MKSYLVYSDKNFGVEVKGQLSITHNGDLCLSDSDGVVEVFARDTWSKGKRIKQCNDEKKEEHIVTEMIKNQLSTLKHDLGLIWRLLRQSDRHQMALGFCDESKEVQDAFYRIFKISEACQEKEL